MKCRTAATVTFLAPLLPVTPDYLRRGPWQAPPTTSAMSPIAECKEIPCFLAFPPRMSLVRADEGRLPHRVDADAD